MSFLRFSLPGAFAGCTRVWCVEGSSLRMSKAGGIDVLMGCLTPTSPKLFALSEEAMEAHDHILFCADAGRGIAPAAC